MRGSLSKKLLTNGLLAVASAALAWLAVEVVVFRLLLPYLPLKLHGYLDPGIRALAQSSKKGAIPRHYIALVGDSYAQGFGDWLLEADHNRNPPFHSGHLIAAGTGRDVISFGSGGGGSLKGIVSAPVSQYEYLRATLLFAVAPPDEILVYFFEGNDLNDNLRDLSLRYFGEFDAARIHDPAYFRDFIREVAVERSPVFKAARSFPLSDNLFCYRMVRRMLAGGAEPYRAPPFTVSGLNRAIVAGGEVTLPDELQGPSLELSEEELRLGLYVFEQSLRFLTGFFRDSKVTVLYIPSPLASYRLASATVSAQSYEGRGSTFPADAVAQRSDWICTEVGRIASSRGCGFIDSRSAIRAAAAAGLVHGPRDWKHLNKAGYTALAEMVLRSRGPRPQAGTMKGLR